MSSAQTTDTRYTVDAYFDLVGTGMLQPEDRVELLDGVIISMPPQNPPHASGITFATDALRAALGRRALVRAQLPLVLGVHSAPDPDVAVVPGDKGDYLETHPTTAFLVVEVADSSLAQDRLTKARLYAAARIPEYWIVNLHDRCVEIYRAPDPQTGGYTERRLARPGEQINIATFPDVRIDVADVIPPRSAE